DFFASSLGITLWWRIKGPWWLPPPGPKSLVDWQLGELRDAGAPRIIRHAARIAGEQFLSGKQPTYDTVVSTSASSTRLRPWCLARYSASSAAWIRSSALFKPESRLATATPKLAVKRISPCSAATARLLRDFRKRSAWLTAVISLQPGNTIMNSSPP